MILTGQTSTHQSIYPQSGFSFEMDTSSMRDLNLTFLGPTGLSGKFQFFSGKIYNPSGLFISTYNTGQPLNFLLNYATGKYSTWINNTLIEANRSLSTGSATFVSGFSFSGRTPGTSEYSVSIYGNRPGLYFSPLTTQDLQNFSGYVLVTGQMAQMYSVTPTNATGQVLTTNRFNSGNYYISGQSGRFTSGSTVSADFVFDFGLHSEELIISYDFGLTPTGYINLSSEESQTGIFDIRRQYQDLSATLVWQAPTSFETYLEFLYRSGYTDIYATGHGTGLYSGYVSGSGFITGTSISGFCNTGYFYQYTGTRPTGLSPSLMVTGTGSVFAYATGQIVSYYQVMVTGYEATSVGLGIDNTTGWLSGYITGMVGPGSGTYHFYQSISGRPRGTGLGHWSGQYTQGNGSHSGYYHSPDNPSSVYLSVENGGYSDQENYLGIIDFTGVLATTMRNYPSSGSFTGTVRSDLIYSTGRSLITGFNFFTGEYNELTGVYSYVTGNFTNFYLSYGYNLTSGTLRASQGINASGVFSVGARMTYDQNIPWGVVDYARIHARNSNGHSVYLDTYGYSVG